METEIDSIITCNIANFFYSMCADGIPYDGVPLEEVVTVHTSVTVIIIFLACCGIILTDACLVFNFLFRKRK